MSAKKHLNIGLVGYGFMGRTHSNAYKRVNDFFDVPYRPVLKAICGRTADGAKAFASQWGYESVETDWRKLIERKDIDAIDICTPNNTHAEIAIGAWVSFGVQMSIASMSFRSMSFFQSVSCDSYCHFSANFFAPSAVRPQTALSTGRYSRSKKSLTRLYAFECVRPMKP